MAVSEKEQLQALLEFYKEQCANGRHIETQRQYVTTFLFAAGGVLIGLMGTLRFSIHCLPLAVLLIGLGVFGKRFVEMYETKWEETSARRNAYRLGISALADDVIPAVAVASAGASSSPPASVSLVASVKQANVRQAFIQKALETGYGVATATPAGRPPAGSLRLFWRNAFVAVTCAGCICLLLIAAVVFVRTPKNHNWADSLIEQLANTGN